MSNDTVTEITTVASAITPVAGDIGEVAKLGDDVVQVVAPFINSARNDKPLNEYRERITQYEQIVDNPNEAQRDAQLGNFVNQLFLDAGIPVGLVGGEFRRVPVEYFDGFIQAVGTLIREREEHQAADNAVKQTTK